MGQPAYLTASAQKALAPCLAQLVQGTVKAMSAAFGSVLIVEIWSGLELEELAEPDGIVLKPAFKIVAPNQNSITNTLETLESELGNIKVHQTRAEVSLVYRGKPTPPRLPSLLTETALDQFNCSVVGIVIRPFYRHTETGEILPLVHQAMLRDFSLALQRTFYTFTRKQTQYQPPHYQMLGRHATVKAVWHIDKQLADISSSFDYLLQVTPVNANEAWTKFKRHRFERQPIFRYRPHAVDPALLKRQLWNIRVERVEDPTLQHLFREKRKELDTQITMLGNMNKPGFLLGSLQLYGGLDAQLVATAKTLLEKISPHSREKTGQQKLDAQAFASYARTEIKSYQQELPGFDAKVRVQSNIVGLMVSHGHLLIGADLKISQNRAEALLAHEVGVHILTYFNGQAQPFHLLRSGLAGYEELQEGLAVLAEYLVGGLSKPRLRLLAARVIAANNLIEGATFIDTFQTLKGLFGFKQLTAFKIALRIYRAGGLTKDAVYLRGLLKLLAYLQNGPLDDLFYVGKIAMDHLPIIEELQRRNVLTPPTLRPHFLNSTQAKMRLVQLAQGLSALNLVDREKT